MEKIFLKKIEFPYLYFTLDMLNDYERLVLKSRFKDSKYHLELCKKYYQGKTRWFNEIKITK